MPGPDVAVIGGGVVGCAAALRVAERGGSVVLYERAAIGAGASGRNSGAVQHPFDTELTAAHAETVALYRRLAEQGADLKLAAEPAGLLLLAADAAHLEPGRSSLARAFPELAPRLLDPAELAALEPAVAPGTWALRLQTAYPVRPAAAAVALADAAARRGAVLRVGEPTRPWVADGRARGVTVGSKERVPAGAVLVAAGPWSAELVGLGQAIRPVWGVVAEIPLLDPPGHVLEEAGVEADLPIAEDADAGQEAPSLFSMVTAERATSVGSNFLAWEPDAASLAPALRDRGARWVPALAGAPVISARACARPQSADGRPLVGPVPGIGGLHIAAGHGPWGISAGPAAGFLAADVLLGAGRVPPALAAERFVA